MDKEALAHWAENFETSDLLEAVGEIDEARGYLNDLEDCGPPELRRDLLKLHQIAMNVAHDGAREKAREMFDLAFELRDQLSELMDHVERAHAILDTMIDFAPELTDEEVWDKPEAK